MGDPTIAPIVAPVAPAPPDAPAPPAAPQAPTPPEPNPSQRARDLAKMLPDKRKDLLNEIKKLKTKNSEKDFDALEKAMIETLLKDKNTKQAYELLRIIRFVRDSKFGVQRFR
jgi:hypothetical protein